MEAALPSRQLNRLLDRNWLITLVVAVFGLGLGAVVAFNPRIGLGVSVLPILAFLVLPNPKLGLYMIAAWLPFESLASLNSDFSSFKLIGVVAFFSWFIRLARTRQVFINPRNKAGLVLMLFLAISALSITQAQYPAVGVDRLITMIQLVVLYFMVVDLTHDEATFKNTLLILTLAGIPAALIGVFQFILGGANRAIGVSMDPNYSALNILILIPLAFAFVNGNQGNKRSLYWTVFFLLLIGTLANLSRGAMVAVVVMFFFLSRNGFVEPLLKKRLRILFFVVTLSGVFLALLDPRFSLSSILVSGGSGRLDIWQTAWRIWLDHPVLGVGIQNYKFAFYKYASYMPWINLGNVKAMVAHNTYIETAVETGIIGLAAFVGLLGLSLLELSRARWAYAGLLKQDLAVDCSMLMIGIIGFLVAGFFLSTMPQKALWFLLGLAASRSQTGSSLTTQVAAST